MARHHDQSAIRIKTVRRPVRGAAVHRPVHVAAEAPFLHLFVARAASSWRVPARWVPGTPSGHRDGGQRVTATDPAEVLVWEMHATIG